VNNEAGSYAGFADRAAPFLMPILSPLPTTQLAVEKTKAGGAVDVPLVITGLSM